MASEQRILDKLYSQLDDMFPAERKAAEFILDQPERAAQISITELAELSGASDATIIRMCKRLGCTGFYQLKLRLSSELGFIRLLGPSQPSEGSLELPEILRLIARNIIEMEQSLNADRLGQVARLLLKSPRVYVLAAGNSIPSAMDLTYRLTRLGIRAACNTVIENTLNDISLGRSDETVVVISHSGSSRHVVVGMELAKKQEMHTVILTRSLRNPLSPLADYCILTKPISNLFQNFGMASHLLDNVVVDLLLYQIISIKEKSDAPDPMELLLSEFKL